MELQSKLLFFEWAAGILVALYLLQAWYVGKLIKTLRSINTQNHNFVMQMLEQSKVSLNTQLNLLESMKILSDRVASYNERLNENNEHLRLRNRGG